jgi:starch synthase
MKIACLSFWFYDYTIQFANSLAGQGEVLLLLPDITPPEYLENISDEVDVHLFAYARPSERPLAALSLIREIRAAIARFSPDVVHYQVNNPMLCPLLPFLRRYPLVATFHDITPHAGEDRAFDPAALSYRLTLLSSRLFSDAIFVHGRALQRIMTGKYHVPAAKVHEIPIGEHEVAPFKKHEDPALGEPGDAILFFGRIYRYKGLEYLIRAAPAIRERMPDARIVIAGAGEDFQRYEELMQGMDCFEVHNYRIPYAEGAVLFQRSGVVVLPYTEASQSGVIPTAYSFRKPVVVTDVGSIPEIVDDGKTGFVVPPADPDALAAAIVKILSDPLLRREMGENAYRKLKTDLAWDGIVEKTLAVYTDLVGGRQG